MANTLKRILEKVSMLGENYHCMHQEIHPTGAGTRRYILYKIIEPINFKINKLLKITKVAILKTTKIIMLKKKITEIAILNITKLIKIFKVTELAILKTYSK